MALLEMEGFDWAPGSNQLVVQLLNKVNPSTGAFLWSGSVGQGSGTTGLNPIGGKGMLFNNAGSAQCTPGGNFVTWFGGVRYKMPNPLNANQGVLTMYDAANIQIGLALNASAKLFVFRGPSVGNVLGTGTTTIVAGGTYYIEFKGTIDPTVGAFTVKLDGATEISVSGVNTRNSANSFANIFRIESEAGTSTVVDDFYLADTTGSAPYNDFLSLGGPIAIETLFPTSNNVVAFTPNASTNVSQIQETTWDGDGTFNFSASNAQVDTFNHGNLSSTPAQIYAVSVWSSMRKDDVTVQNGRTKLISGGTTQNGASFNLVNGVYVHLQDIYINDPNTAAAWVGANVNATKVGYEHV